MILDIRVRRLIGNTGLLRSSDPTEVVSADPGFEVAQFFMVSISSRDETGTKSG